MAGDVMCGFSLVHKSKDDPYDIYFGAEKEDHLSEKQIALKKSITKVLTVNKKLFNGDEERLKRYFDRILPIAQLGLLAAFNQPDIAAADLDVLKDEMIMIESEQLKNKYAIQLAKWGIFTSIPLFLLWIIFRFFYVELSDLIFTCFILWVGSMIGVWISFVGTKFKITFDEVVEYDNALSNPIIRLIFVGILTLVMAAMIKYNIVKLSIGGFNANEFDKTIISSLLLGVICGICEKVLALRITQQAEKTITAENNR